MKDELTEALGLPDLSPQQFERARKRILEDSFFYTRCLSTLVLGVAPRVAESLHPLEKARMRKISEAEVAPRGKASWGIEAQLHTGVETLRAQCSTCGQDMRFAAPKPWSEEKVYHEGTINQSTQTIWHEPTRADVKYQIEHLHWQHCGHSEKCPPELAMIWEEKLYARIRRS
jgi:rRNA maturation protein Nop10